MLMIQKMISNLILSPSLIIIILFFIYLGSFKKIKNTRKYILFLAFFVYLISIEPVKDLILRPLEKSYPPVTEELLKKADAYIVLGSGIYENAPMSLNKEGIPTETALSRLIEAVRLYRESRKKIFLSGGIVYKGEKSEAEVSRKLLIDLGVRKRDIILEGTSRTTAENAKNTVKLLQKNKIKKPILITSATHMRRSVKSFKRKGVDVIPAPCDYSSRYSKYNLRSYMPSIKNISDINKSMWEYIGIIYYTIKNE